MKNLLLITVLLLFAFNSSAQQTIKSEPSVYYYTLEVENVDELSDDATIKVVQTALRSTFDVVIPINNDGEFTISTSFRIEELKTAQVLLNSGFELKSFVRKTDMDRFTINMNQ
jgi:hypothetical protein